MPTPTIFEGINPRGTQTFIPCKDISALPRSEQAVLGAKNFWKNGNVSFTKQYSYDVSNIPSGDYIFSADVTSSDIDATTCQIYDITNNRMLGQIERGTQKSISITLTNTATIALYASSDSGKSTGDSASFKNVMIRFATDTDPTYVPYAMTNKELTEQFPTKYTSTGLTITNGTISEGGYCKIGNVVLVNIRLQATEAGTAVDIVGLPTYTGANKVICSGANFTDDVSAYAYITTGGHLYIKASDVVANKNYAVSAVYLAV